MRKMANLGRDVCDIRWVSTGVHDRGKQCPCRVACFYGTTGLHHDWEEVGGQRGKSDNVGAES